MPEDEIDEIEKLLDENEEVWSIDMTDELTSPLALAYADGLRLAAEEIALVKGISVGVSFDVVDPKVIEFIENRAAEMVKNVNKGTKFYLRNAIRVGVEEGLDEDQLVSEIMDKLFQRSDFSEGRVRSIAGFEIGQAQSHGFEKQMEEVGLKSKRWVTIGKDACAVCRGNEEMGPQPVGSKNFLNVWGEKTSGPPAHPNYCRCHIAPVPGELDKLGEVEFFTG